MRAKDAYNRSSQQVVSILEVIGESPSGKATGFDPVIRRFDPYLLSQYAVSVQALALASGRSQILGRVPLMFLIK